MTDSFLKQIESYLQEMRQRQQQSQPQYLQSATQPAQVVQPAQQQTAQRQAPQPLPPPKPKWRDRLNSRAQTGLTVVQTPPEYDVIVQKILSNLDVYVYGMWHAKRAALASVIAKLDFAIFSRPGEAKTWLIDVLAKSVGAKYFRKLFTFDTTTADILGPPIIKQNGDKIAIEYDISKGILNANIALLDEVYKAPGPVLVLLYSIMANRKADFGGVTYELTDLWTVVGLTNIKELEERLEEAAVEPLHDRFVVRLFLERTPVNEMYNILDLMYSKSGQDPRLRKIEQVATPDDVRRLQKLNDDLLVMHYQRYKAVLMKIVEAASDAVDISPRKVVMLMRLLPALDIVGVRGLMSKAVYVIHSLSNNPDELKQISESVQKKLNFKIYNQIEELIAQIEREINRKNFGYAEDLMERAVDVVDKLPSEEDRETYYGILQYYATKIPP